MRGRGRPSEVAAWSRRLAFHCGQGCVWTYHKWSIKECNVSVKSSKMLFLNYPIIICLAILQLSVLYALYDEKTRLVITCNQSFFKGCAKGKCSNAVFLQTGSFTLLSNNFIWTQITFGNELCELHVARWKKVVHAVDRSFSGWCGGFESGLVSYIYY